MDGDCNGWCWEFCWCGACRGCCDGWNGPPYPIILSFLAESSFSRPVVRSFVQDLNASASGTKHVNPPAPGVATGNTINQTQENTRDRPSSQRENGATQAEPTGQRVLSTCLLRERLLSHAVRRCCGLRQKLRWAEQTESAKAKIKKIIKNASNAK